MIAHYEETKYRTVDPSSYVNRTAAEAISLFEYRNKAEKFHPPLFGRFSDATIGRGLYHHFFPLLEGLSLLGGIWNTINQATNHEVAKEAEKILSIFQEIFLMFRQFELDLTYLPPLRAFNGDDDSILIEWIFRDFRIGFTIEPDLEESGWYLVSNKNLGEISASGYTSNIDIKRLVLWLFNFVLSNA